MLELGEDHKEPKEQLAACTDCWRELLSDVHDSSVVQQGVTKQKAHQHRGMPVQGQIPWELVLFKLCKKNPHIQEKLYTSTTAGLHFRAGTCSQDPN